MTIKLPPLVVLTLFGGLMYLLDRFLPVGEFDFFGRTFLAWFLLGLGTVLILVALVQFKRSGATTDPMDLEKSNTLVTGGVYKYSRNPMYLGMLLLLLAFGLYLGNAFNTLLAALFVSFMNRFQIKREEERLLKKFSGDYPGYLRATRRWF